MEVLGYPYDIATCLSLKHLMDCPKVIPLIKRADNDMHVSIDCTVEAYLA